MTDREAMKLALEALEGVETWVEMRPKTHPWDTWKRVEPAIIALREALTEQPAQQKPVALEAVYETIIHWDEGGGKRSRRELASRIVALYTAPPQRKPLTDEQATKAALWDLAVSKGLVTVHSEQLAPGTWSAHLSVASWIEGHDKACDISNEAAHGIKGDA